MPTETLHEKLVAQLLELPREEWPAVADAAKVPLPTLTKIAYRQIVEPGLNKSERLLRVLGARRAASVNVTA